MLNNFLLLFHFSLSLKSFQCLRTSLTGQVWNARFMRRNGSKVMEFYRPVETRTYIWGINNGYLVGLTSSRVWKEGNNGRSAAELSQWGQIHGNDLEFSVKGGLVYAQCRSDLISPVFRSVRIIARCTSSSSGMTSSDSIGGNGCDISIVCLQNSWAETISLPMA